MRISHMTTGLNRYFVAVALTAVVTAAGCIDQESGQDRATSVVDREGTELRTQLLGHLQDIVADGQQTFEVVEAIFDSKSRVIVAEPLDYSVRIYDVSGKRLFEFGGFGEGPGEFSSISGLGVIEDTVIYVADGQNGTLNFFGPDGHFLVRRLWQSEFGTMGTRLFFPTAPQVIESRQRGIVRPLLGDRSPTPAEIGVAVANAMEPIILIDSTGMALDTLAWHETTGTVIGWQEASVPGVILQILAPFSSDDLTALAENGSGVLTVGITSAEQPSPSYSLAKIDLKGDTVLNRTFRYEPVPMDEETISLAVRMTPVFPQAAADSLDRARIRDQLERHDLIPRFQRPISAIVPNQDGTIWLAREATLGQLRYWDLMDSGGNFVGWIQLPVSHRVLATRGELLAVLEQESTAGLGEIGIYAIDNR